MLSCSNRCFIAAGIGAARDGIAASGAGQYFGSPVCFIFGWCPRALLALFSKMNPSERYD
jgi:hypothetical protein